MRTRQVPAHELFMWMEAVGEVLGVSLLWMDAVIYDGLIELASRPGELPDLMMRCAVMGVPDVDRSVLIMRWLSANGGIFVRTNSGCMLTWHGVEYQVSPDSAFATLFWKLSGTAGHPITVTSVWDAVFAESLSLADAKFASEPCTLSAVRSGLRPPNDFVKAIDRLLSIAAGPECDSRRLLERLVDIRMAEGEVTVSGPANKLRTILTLYARQRPFSSVDEFRKILARNANELRLRGVSWEETSVGRGKPKVFHITQKIFPAAGCNEQSGAQ